MSDQEKWDPQAKAENLSATIHQPEPEQTTTDRPHPVGIVNARLVRKVFFFVITLCLFFTGGLCLLAVWDVIQTAIAYQAIATFFITTATLGLFVILNELFPC